MRDGLIVGSVHPNWPVVAGKESHDPREIFRDAGAPFGSGSHEVLVIVCFPNHHLAGATKDISVQAGDGTIHPGSLLAGPFRPKVDFRSRRLCEQVQLYADREMWL